MTATAACRVELEALRERLSAIIRELAHAERLVAVYDLSVEPPAAPDFAPDPQPQRRVTARAKAAPAKPNGQPHPRTGPATYAGGADIISALGAAREPMSPTHLIRVTKLPRWRVMKTLLLMHATGQLVKVGKNRSAKYALPSAPRSGAVAGTRALLPGGPPSASGGDFEVAWNGTKERTGQAPPILSAAGRERKG